MRNHSIFFIFLLLYHIKQLDSIMLWVCSVIDYRYQNVGRRHISDKLGCSVCHFFFFLSHFDVICDLTEGMCSNMGSI